MKKIYGIYKGCIYEGGRCYDDVYTRLEGARRRAIIEVDIENDEMKKANKKGFDFKLYIEKSLNHWISEHDEIKVIEFKVNHE